MSPPIFTFTSGGIWATATFQTIGTLFLVQSIAGLLVGLLIIFVCRVWVAIVGVGFAHIHRGLAFSPRSTMGSSEFKDSWSAPFAPSGLCHRDRHRHCLDCRRGVVLDQIGRIPRTNVTYLTSGVGCLQNRCAVTKSGGMQCRPDPRALTELLEESQDLQADAPAADPRSARRSSSNSNHSPNDEDHASNQAFHVEHQDRLRASLGATTVCWKRQAATALVGLLASPAFASSSSDVQILQTANSIENLAISTYKAALTLPYIGGSAANPVVTKFCQVTMGQHMQHDDAFSAAVKQLGGKAQNAPDPAFVPVVNNAVKSITAATPSAGALQVVALALELENIAAETYVKDTVLAKSTTNKALFASIMGIEAQHASVLLAVQALLQAGAPQLISLAPGTAAMLPAAAGSVKASLMLLQDQPSRPG